VSEFETERLVVRAPDDGELQAMLAVYDSNPFYIELTEGVAGAYDLGRLERDLAVAHSTPGRELAAVLEKESGELIGVLDTLLENESDGKPWIGLLMIRADRQHEGFASEVVLGFGDRLRELGVSVVRSGVIDGNEAGRRLTERLGFEQVRTTAMRMGSGERTVRVLERRLD
jgi:RimJ/RimL family protein N-acetyltransferase